MKYIDTRWTVRIPRTAQLVLFAVLGALMFISKIVMAGLPNIHLVGILTMVYTLVFREKALVPIYVYVFLVAFDYGFSPYWIANLYIWLVLWGATMVLPRRMPAFAAVAVYMTVCGLHGLLFGVLWSPTQALLFGLDFGGMVAWIIAGLPWDLVHGIGNFCAGILICPITALLTRLEQQSS